jgi:hypothetical protein
MSKKLKAVFNLQNRVKYYLELREDLRDNDEKLIANIWRDQVEKKYGENILHKMSAYDFLKICFIEGVVTSSDTITRARRKVQENNAHLRGKYYEERKTEEKQFRKGISE